MPKDKVIDGRRRFSPVYSDIIRGVKDARAIGLYCILCDYAGSNDYAYPSLPKLADDMGLSANSLNTVRGCLRTLEAYGLITVFSRWINRKNEVSYRRSEDFNTQTSNGYVVWDGIGCSGSREARALLERLGIPPNGGADSDTGGLLYKNPGGCCTRTRGVAVQEPEEIHNEEIHNEVNNPLPPLRDSAAEGAALVPLGDPQAGTPTHTNHGSLQPVNESDPQGLQQGRGKLTKRQLDEEFERFWMLVGRKRGKQQARKSFERQRRTHDLEFICSQITKAQDEWLRMGREPEYWPHPSTWLNQQLDDDYDTVRMPSQQEFYEARVQMLRERHLREKDQLKSISQSSPILAFPASPADDDDSDGDDWEEWQ